MRGFTGFTVLVGVLLTAGAAAAQSGNGDIEALTPGRRFISFTAKTLEHGGGGSLGLWRVTAPDHSRGWIVDVTTSYTHSDYPSSIFITNGTPVLVTDTLGIEESQAFVSVAVGPEFRHYLARSAPVAAFVESGVNAGISYSHMHYEIPSGTDATSWNNWVPRLGGNIGAGAEWFPLRRVSFSGQAGVNASVGYGRTTLEAGSQHQAQNQWSASLGTFVSALLVQVYF